MSEAESVGKKLALVRLSDKERAENVSAEEFFQKRILPFLRKMADFAAAKVEGSCESAALEVPDSIAVEVKRMLIPMALEVPKFKGLNDRSLWSEEKIAVRLVQDYFCHVLVARDAEEVDMGDYAPGKNYYFRSDQFAEVTKGNDSYHGDPHWKIKRDVESREGRNSGAAKDIKKVIKLIRTLLYNPELKDGTREKLAAELCELRMKVGDAAKAVIADFINHYDNDGWLRIMPVIGAGADPIQESGAFDNAMGKLKVGRFDLRKLV